MANKQGGVGCYRSFLTHFKVLISRSPSVYHSLIHCQGSLSIFTVTRRSMLSGCRYAKSLIITIVVIDCVHFLSCLSFFLQVFSGHLAFFLLSRSLQVLIYSLLLLICQNQSIWFALIRISNFVSTNFSNRIYVLT